MTGIVFTPIGIVRSPFRDPRNMPIQPLGARGVRGTVELDPACAAGVNYPALKGGASCFMDNTCTTEM